MKIRDHQELTAIINEMESERRAIIEHIYYIIWHMRGGLSREEAWSLSDKERKIIIKQIDERVKQVEKTNLAII